jgi:hypothetical protein
LTSIITSSPTTQADASLSTDSYAASVAAATGGDVFIPVQAATPPAIIAQAPVTHAIGICSVIDTSMQSKMPDFSPFPTTQAQIYFSDLDIEKAQIQVISSPQHGALVPGLHRDNMPYPSSDWDGSAYHPDAGYTGYDKFSMRVSDGKYSIVIYYNLQIFDGLPYANAANQDPWCIGQNFKISSKNTKTKGSQKQRGQKQRGQVHFKNKNETKQRNKETKGSGSFCKPDQKQTGTEEVKRHEDWFIAHAPHPLFPISRASGHADTGFPDQSARPCPAKPAWNIK